MNKVFVSGRLAQNPETRYTQTGKAVTLFHVAVNRYAGGKEQTDYIPVVTWEKLAETCGNNLAKGRLVLVEGRLQIRKYESPGGPKRSVAEIIASAVEFMDSAREKDPARQSGTGVPFGDDMPF